MKNSALRMLAAASVSIVLAACRPAPADPQPTDRIDYRRLRPVSIASIRNGQAPAAAVMTNINPSIVHADVEVTDILQPYFESLGAPDPELLRVTIRFTAPDLVGRRTPIRFNLPSASIECRANDSRLPMTRLEFQTDRYTAIVPKGRHLQDGLPSYLTCGMRSGAVDYQIASVPLVYAVRMPSPVDGSSFPPDGAVTAVLQSVSYGELWSNNNPHARFRHQDTVTTTERAADGTERVVGGAIQWGSPDRTQEISALPIAPFAASGSDGRVYATTRYVPDEYTLGPSHFILSWVSISGVPLAQIRWE